MLPIFTSPLALLGLAALPTLAAIYWLRNRFRRQPVSSLMLWADHRDIREGGARKHRLQTPLIFYLELLTLLLLAVAAAAPHIQTASGTRPLLVVLDDSFSMAAGGNDSPRQQAIAAVEKELRDVTYQNVRFLLAADRPQFLGDPVRSAKEARALLEGWKCRAPRSRLDEALALASELAGDRALVLVVTDHAPESPPGKGRVQWRAFGAPRPNKAFVNATRTPHGAGERCFLEIANLSDTSRPTNLRVTAGQPPEDLKHMTLSLDPGEKRRLTLDLPHGTPALHAEIDADDLDIDDRVVLLPSSPKPIRVQLRLQNKVLRELVEKAVRVTLAQISDDEPHLVITDQEGTLADTEAWVLLLVQDQQAESYAGPFIVDRSHPLTKGLELQGVVWGAGQTENLPGTSVIAAGNVPLLSDAPAGDRHDLRMRLRPDLSTLPESPNWPILFWNLVQWRTSAEPGLSRLNLRLGDDTTLTLRSSLPNIQITEPTETQRSLTVQGRRVVLRPDDTGVYQIQVPDETYRVAVNALNEEESDLTGCVAGRWGDWLDDTTLRLEYQNIAWTLLLAALGALTLHTYLIARGARRERP
jgi:hypothetical protein